MPEPKITFIIPCYNESSRLNITRQCFVEFCDKHAMPICVIFVNDGSRDNTADLLADMCKYLTEKYTDNYFNYISYTSNIGKGWALYQGIRQCETQWCLTLDADMASRPEEVLRWMKEYDIDLHPDKIFIGSREEGIEQGLVKSSNIRRFIGQVFNKMVVKLTSLSVRDTQCGYKLYPTHIATKAFAGLSDYGFAHDIEVLLKVKMMGMQIIPLPVTWQEVKGSKVNLITDSLQMLITVLRVRRKFLLRKYTMIDKKLTSVDK